ncbi:MAG: response regulator [Planctomycetes bacterium]|nr:response regulator [Planctomycetota bacterium]
MSEQLKFMICDDSRTQRSYIINALDQYDIEFMESSNGKEFITFLDLHEGEFDLCTLDINMEELDGIETLEKLQTMSIKLPPIIIVTTENNKMMVVKAIQMDVEGYLCKPFKPEQLTEQVQSILSQNNKKLCQKD